MANPFAVAADLQWGATSPFRGAEYNRLSADRWTAANHPDTEIRYAARALRARARDLVRNNAYAAGVVESFADNVIGWEGIRYKPRVTNPRNDPNGELDRATNWELERGWLEWAAEYASVDGVESWLEVERLLAKSWVADGEVFIRHRRGWKNPHGYAIELIDPDLLDETFNEKREGATGREIVMGVEIDEHGRPLAYHFWKHHPDELRRRERVRIPASEIVHFFVRYRAGQRRGYSLFAPALTTVEMIDGLSEAELVASRAAASKMGFITNNSDEAKALYAARVAQMNQAGKEWQPKRIRMAPAVIDELIPGQGFESFDPTHPNTALEAFLKIMLQAVARGFAMSYLTLTGDVSAANYSSMRAGLQPERDHWKLVQNVFARRVHRPINRAWLASALLEGALDLPSLIASDYTACEWRGRRWQWVDPKNDLEAAEMEVKLGVNSRQRLAADRGLDYETVVDETADDLAYAREQGVYVGGMNTPAKPAGAKPAESNGNGNGQGSHSRLAPYTEALHG